MPDAPYRPVNPWGRAMPAALNRATEQFQYQVFAEPDEGEFDLPISPKFCGADGLKAAEMVAEAANTAIIKRLRPEWINAYIHRTQAN